MILAFALAMAATAPLPPSKPSVNPFGPLIRKVGNWDLRRTQTGVCNASAGFGDKISLAIFLQPDRRVGMVIGSAGWTYSPKTFVSTIYAFESNEFSGKSEVFAEQSGRSVTALFDSDFLGAFRRSKRLDIYIGADAEDLSSESTESLTFVDNAPVVDALLACADQSSGAAGTLAATPPRYLNKAQVITADDYPSAALRAEIGGTVRYRVAVSETGRAIGCNVLISSGNAELDAQSCALILRRARFEPARNSAGQAVSGNIEARVFWRVPAS